MPGASSNSHDHLLTTELFQDFVEETLEQRDDVEPRIVEAIRLLEQSGELDDVTIDTAFRFFHTLKGNANFLGLSVFQHLAHRTEDFLEELRHQRIQAETSHLQWLCRVFDLLERVLGQLLATGTDAGARDEANQLLEEIVTLLGGEAPPTLLVPEPDAESRARLQHDPDLIREFVAEADEQLQAAADAIMVAGQEPNQRQEALARAFRNVHSFKGNSGFMGLANQVELSSRIESIISALQHRELPFRDDTDGLLLTILDVLRDSIAGLSNGGGGIIDDFDSYITYLEDYAANVESPQPASDAAPELPAENATRSEPGRGQSILRQDIRVQLDKLDTLINMVGELVIAESMVTRHAAVSTIEDESFERAVHQLRRVSADLQDMALSVRMVPLSTTFRKMLRLVHDISRRMGKPVRLELAGEDTEVDKTVIEQIADPLVHLIRNAVDHGIEPAEERKAAGKPEVGTILLEGRHEAGEVWIYVRDDGRGLNRKAILARAIAMGLTTAHDAASWSDSRIYRFIFEPGFSTAAALSDISGRGVGMDVVRTNVEQLQGRVDIFSKPGQGTAVLLRLPLTLAIIDGMLVSIGSSRYTIPLLSIRETFQPKAEQIVVTPDGQEMVEWREHHLPVLRLHQLFNKTPVHQQLIDGIVVVVEDAGQQTCLFVDELCGQQSTVVKALSTFLEQARAVSGCTILGDGRVSLILDIRGILDMTRDKWIHT